MSYDILALGLWPLALGELSFPTLDRDSKPQPQGPRPKAKGHLTNKSFSTASFPYSSQPAAPTDCSNPQTNRRRRGRRNQDSVRRNIEASPAVQCGSRLR